MDRPAALELMKAHIRQDEPITDADFSSLAAGFTISLEKKKAFFTRQGEACRHFAFVASGCLRAFSTDERGDEYTMYFAFKDWWIGDKTSFYSDTPARFSTQVIEEAELLICGKADWERALAEIPTFERWYRNKVRRSYEAAQQKLIEAHSESAEQKYRKLIERSPEIVSRIPQAYIASYLGIKPPSLSRIRRKMAGGSIS
jgi:CRP/FNR family transcriptional regulator